MTTLPRIVSLLIARTSLGVVALSFALLGAWTVSDIWSPSPGRAAAFAQKKPRAEEEEEAPAKTPPKKPRLEEEEDAPKPKPKVIRVEEEEDAKAKPGPARPDAPVAGDLRQLAEQATHRGARTLFMELAIPHDRVVLKRLQGVTSGSKPIEGHPDVEPIPVYLGSNPASYHKDLTLHPLAKGQKPYKPLLTRIDHVRPYEQIAQDEVRKFLKVGYDQKPPKNDEYLSHFDTLVVAEQALSAVLRWHESARQTGQRSGKEWEPVESGLRKQLLDDVLLKQMDVLVASRDWERVLALTRRLLATYTDEKDIKSISRPVAGLIQAALKDPTADEERKKQARKRLLDLVTEFPDNPVFLAESEDLRAKAQRLLDSARELGSGKNDAEKKQIDDLLRRAEETWPQLQELRAYKLERSVEHPVLRVGVRGRLPKYLSPGWACTDTEQRAVELLFESLVKLVPDEAGTFRYRPGLAEYRPKVVPLGRHFQLPRNALWSDNKRLNSSDVRFTVGLLKTGVGLGRSRAWGELLDQVEVKSDAYQVTLRLHQGYLDPLALMTFKILPNHQAQVVDTEEFAKNPVGSGPFRLDPTRHSDDNRECMFFLANSSYGTRPGKPGLPRIQEVRFYTYTNPVEELGSGKLDLVLDLTAEQVNQLRQKANDFHVEAPLPAPTAPKRRIYFLAINQSKLPDANLRKALAYAINREQLLNDHFRGDPKNPLPIHKALNGPFPAGSWACNPALANRQGKGSLDLYDADKARTLSPQAAVRALAPLKLKYPEGDPTLEKALKDLCEQVKSTTGMVLELSPCDPRQLRQDVERTQSYDLAYYHYDFPDETYWLWPLLGPPLREGGDSNIFKFADDRIQPALQAVKRYRDFAQVREHQWTVHKVLMEDQMPFIPLWQLDPLLAYSHAVKPAALDPLLVFTNIEEWRLQRQVGR